MITHHEWTDETGETHVHDCVESGCSVSWDGYALRDLTPEDMWADEATRPANLRPVPAGSLVPEIQVEKTSVPGGDETTQQIIGTTVVYQDEG